jgi:penicillin-binding protein 2B
MHGTTKDLAGCVTTVVEEIANYANINYKKEDEKVTTKQINLDSYINQNVDETKTKLENLGLKVIVIGQGNKIVNQNPLRNQTVIKGETVFLVTNKKPYIMPNMNKWSSADAILFAKLIGINYEINGYGKVASTSISEGSEINLDDTLVINLEK